MKESELVVKINANFEWLYPPKDEQEKIIRKHADTLAGYNAQKLEQGVKLILLEILNENLNKAPLTK